MNTNTDPSPRYLTISDAGTDSGKQRVYAIQFLSKDTIAIRTRLLNEEGLENLGVTAENWIHFNSGVTNK